MASGGGNLYMHGIHFGMTLWPSERLTDLFITGTFFSLAAVAFVVGVYDELSDPNLGSGSVGRALTAGGEWEVWVVVFLPDNNSGQMANNNVRFLTIAQRRRRDDTNFAILRPVSTDTKCGCEFGARL